ncbi:MAG: hypothetical protein NVS1B4_07310 [Gemmatimonadaceae bacterium]
MDRASLLAAAAALIACGGRSPMAPVEIQTLRSAPAIATIAGQPLHLETSLWRDFQPVAPPAGKPLTGVFRVATSAGGTLPADLQVTSAWVVLGDQVWAATTVEERARTSQRLEVVVRGGPQWGPGVTVDVIVELRGPGGATMLLGARGQNIDRTD